MQAIQNPRQEKGQQIAADEGQVFRVAEGFYRVKSQSNHGAFSMSTIQQSAGNAIALTINSGEQNANTFGRFNSASEYERET